MFSWSNNNNSSTSKVSSSYPGRRLQAQRVSATSTAAATPIQGTIRPPSNANKQHTRAQHLNSYIEDPTLQRSTRRVSNDDTTYDTVFQTTKGDTLILRVNIPLGSSFVAFCPVMTLAGVKVRHPWINDTTSSAMRITGYDPIQSDRAWKDSNLLLGAAVHDVVKHFQLNPPQILEITDNGLQSIQTKKKSNGSRTPTRTPISFSAQDDIHCNNDDDAPPSYNVVAESTPAPEVPMPRVPLHYPETGDLSREKLDELLCDELEFKAFVHRLKVFDEIFTIGSSRLDENFILANKNLEKETEWKVLKSEVKGLNKTFKSKLDRYTKLEEKQNSICAPPDKLFTLRKVHKAKKEAFDESEILAEEWVDDGGDVDDFCKRFLERRKVHHMRAAKMELLQNNHD